MLQTINVSELVDPANYTCVNNSDCGPEGVCVNGVCGGISIPEGCDSNDVFCDSTRELMWQKGDSSQDNRYDNKCNTNSGYSNGCLDWYEAVRYCSRVALCVDGSFSHSGNCSNNGGILYDDWYLPEKSVYETLGNMSIYFMDFLQGIKYWTNTTSEVTPTPRAYTLSNWQFQSNAAKGGYSLGWYKARCVRNIPQGYTQPTSDSCNHTAIDPDCWSSEAAGLVWGPQTGQIDTGTSMSDGRGNTVVLHDLDYHSYEAASHCYTLIEDGHDDWYLPSYNELWNGYQSLTSKFPNYGYWSSTGNFSDYTGTTYANAYLLDPVNFQTMTTYDQTMENYVRCLR